MPKKKKKKRKCSAAQLAALAKGRAKRRRLIGKKRTKKRKIVKKPFTIQAKKTRKMTKRRRTATNLTGGSGDVNPQLYSGTISTTTQDVALTSAFLTPISRLPKTGTRAAVMEILRIYVWIFDKAAIAAAGETAAAITMSFGTKDFATVLTAPSEASIFAQAELRRYGAFTALGIFILF